MLASADEVKAAVTAMGTANKEKMTANPSAKVADFK